MQLSFTLLHLEVRYMAVFFGQLAQSSFNFVSELRRFHALDTHILQFSRARAPARMHKVRDPWEFAAIFFHDQMRVLSAVQVGLRRPLAMVSVSKYQLIAHLKPPFIFCSTQTRALLGTSPALPTSFTLAF